VVCNYFFYSIVTLLTFQRYEVECLCKFTRNSIIVTKTEIGAENKLNYKNIIYMSFLFILISCSNTFNNPLIDMGAKIKYDDSNPDKNIQIASVCLKSSRDKDENLLNIKNFITDIMLSDKKTRIILFPETALGLYYDENSPEEYQMSVAETIPGNATNFIGDLAFKYNVYICFGMAEINNQILYNSQVLINPSGNIEAVHRKNNFVAFDKKSGFQSVENYTIVTIDEIKFGLIICADSNSKWLIDKYSENKIDIVLSSLADMSLETEIDFLSRCLNSWVVKSNKTGYEGANYYEGHFGIYNPVGSQVAGNKNGKEGYVVHNIGVHKK